MLEGEPFNPHCSLEGWKLQLLRQSNMHVEPCVCVVIGL